MFLTLCGALYEIPVLKLPDFSKPFVAEPNALDLAVGIVFLKNIIVGFGPLHISVTRTCLYKETMHFIIELLAVFKACMK